MTRSPPRRPFPLRWSAHRNFAKAACARHQVTHFRIQSEQILQTAVLLIAEVLLQKPRECWRLEELHKGTLAAYKSYYTLLAYISETGIIPG